MQDYLQYVRVAKRLAKRTVTLYELDLLKLHAAAQAAGLDALQLQPAHIRRQVAQMHSQGRSGRGIALILSGWRGFYQWAVQQKLIATNPVQDVRAPRAPRPLPKALTADEAVHLAEFRGHAASATQPAVQQDSAWLEARDAAMTELLYSSGLRIGELLGLDTHASSQGQQKGRGWIDWDEAEAHVTGKGQKRRSVPVGKPAMQALRHWLQLRAQTPALAAAQEPLALFISRNGTRMSAQSAWQRLRQRSQLAGLSAPVHPHMLRHSFASHMLQSSADLRGVQELLGHANIATTQVYTRLDFQHLAKVYDAAHPRAQARAGQAPQGSQQPSGSVGKNDQGNGKNQGK